jgi:hypothetical protein
MMNKQCHNDESLSSSKDISKREENNFDSSNDECLSKREKKRRRHDMTEEERRRERRSANRKSAFESRHRRKVRCHKYADKFFLQRLILRVSHVGLFGS